MLELKNIKKDYLSGENMVHALGGVDIEFRKQEFVAILGPSGCGKTTLLNIIGGLDQYTSGDLVINSRSTKNYKDRDWDTYRNHAVGFVFQSYNLIPHQSVLKNVELALTLTGIGKSERKRRAQQALERVGLLDQINKRPNQLSGGQMQRVAIARAIVNNPDIILADEPTGALDRETSIQVMEILKEISKDKLVVMVTHNPELAERYATRTIRLLDGMVEADDNPITKEEAAAPRTISKQRKKTAMSFFVALSLSLNNLMTKKGRTILTAIAGSIGIIGIALILSLSNGINNYITKVQEDTLSSYPINIQAESVDMTSLITTLMGNNTENSDGAHDRDAVYSNTVMYELMNSMSSTNRTTNNLNAFKKFIESGNTNINDYISTIKYSYGVDLGIYTKDTEGTIMKSDSSELIQKAWSIMLGGTGAQSQSTGSSLLQSGYSNMNMWEEMLPGENGELVNSLMYNQYDLVYGEWPEEYNEVVLVVDENNEVSDLLLYTIGLKSSEELEKTLSAAANQEELDESTSKWSYEDICAQEFKLILPWQKYQFDSATESYVDVSATETGMEYLYNSAETGTDIKIVGIIRKNADAIAAMMTGSLGYTSALTEHIIDQTAQAQIVVDQLASTNVNVLNGLEFVADTDQEPDLEGKKLVVDRYLATLSDTDKASVYTAVMAVPSEDYLSAASAQYITGVTRPDIEQMMTEAYSQQMGLTSDAVTEYIAKMDDESLFKAYESFVREQISAVYAENSANQLSSKTTAELAAMLNDTAFSDEQYEYIYKNNLPALKSDKTYDEVLENLGYVDKESPAAMNIYVSKFEDKDKIAEIISAYNETVDEVDKITYTDYVALLMNSITTIINAITYVLVAFVAISLVVSSIMIGIITYISVLERTKEIGILRAMGARKRDISRVFNAETLIDGLISGLVGVGATLLLLLPANLIIHKLTEIDSLNAALPIQSGVILIAISMVLTFIAGLIPSRMAAKKDPVEALRTE